MEQIVTIELFGQPHTFRADSDVTKAKEVADVLVKEVARVESQQIDPSSNISRQQILILAALNIANENVELKKNHSKLLQDVAQRTMKLIGALDDSVQ
ncbi:MAG: cell division protein ZapA [Desulfobacterales bacterium]